MAGNRRSNWIEDQIKRYGEDFVFGMSPESIQRNAKQRIFRDMVKGNIDYSIYGKYFADPKFLENLIIAAENELQNNEVISAALTEFDIRHPNINIVLANKTRFNGLVTIYQVLLSRLQAIKLDYYNIGYLSDIAAVLRRHNNFI